MKSPELLNQIYALVAQAPLVAVIGYFWFTDRKDKLKTIEHLRKENSEKADAIEKFIAGFDKLSISLELIKDRLR